MWVFALAAVFAAAPAGPSVHFEQTTVVSHGGAPGPPLLSRVWMSGPHLRFEPAEAGGGQALILRLDEGRGWRLEPERRAAVRLDLPALRAGAHLDSSTAAELMGAGPGARIRAVAREGRRTIAGRRCTVWRLTAGPTRMEVCLAESVPVGLDAFADLLHWSGADDSYGAILDRLRELRGFPMETRSVVTIMGEPHETLATVTKVVVGPVDAGLFRPPAGWTEEDDVLSEEDELEDGGDGGGR